MAIRLTFLFLFLCLFALPSPLTATPVETAARAEKGIKGPRPSKRFSFDLINTDSPVVLETKKNFADYRSPRPVRIHLRNNTPRWALIMKCSDLEGPGGASIEKKHLAIRPLGEKQEPSSDKQPLSEPIVLADYSTEPGAGTKTIQFFIHSHLGIEQPVGVYRGALRFFYYPEPGAPPALAGTLDIRLEVDTMVSIELQQGELNFGTVNPGEYYPDEMARILVTTNLPGTELLFNMDAIVNQDIEKAIIPSSRFAIGLGETAESARDACRANRLGTNSLTKRLKKPGTYTLFLDGRVRIEPADRPGRHRGAVLITVGDTGMDGHNRHEAQTKRKEGRAKRKGKFYSPLAARDRAIPSF